MPRIIVTLLALIAVMPGFAQSWEAVRDNTAYLYGEGKGATIDEADRNALRDLISKISVHVASNVSNIDTNIVNGEKVETFSQFQSAVSTYSQATLNNTEKRVISNEPDAVVCRWIKREELNKIFDSRKNKVRDYVESAVAAEKKGKADVAIKDYYWALSLLKSLQNPNEVMFETDDDGTVMLMTWIPRQLNEIFANIDATVSQRTGDDLEVLFTYKGKKVNTLDYTYFDGRDWSNICSARDGVGIVELAPGFSGDNFNIKMEYEYRGEAHLDRELESVLQAVSGTPMPKATRNLKTQPATDKQLASYRSTSTYTSVPGAIFKKPEPKADCTSNREAVETVIKYLGKRSQTPPADLFTTEGLDIYEKLLGYGNGKIVGKPELQFYESMGKTYCRGLQMAFNFKNGLRKSFVEEIVFRFDDSNRIDNISFGLGNTAEDDILGKGVWDETARFSILNFLENYQTAYALKRLDYIKDIFDDDAVIITAVVEPRSARKVKSGDMSGLQFGGDIIHYNRHTKDSYISQLARSFASKEYINLRLGSNEVRKLGKGGELYAIQISQEYYSSNYGDKGYLFLMVDLNDPDNPIIKVRTWQPEKDPEFGLYGPEHFN